MKKYILLSALIYMTVLPAGHTRSMAIRRRVNIISKKKQDRYTRNKPFIRSQGRLKRGKQDNKKDLKPAIFRAAVALGAFIAIYQVLYPNSPPRPPTTTGIDTGVPGAGAKPPGMGMGGIPSPPGGTGSGSGGLGTSSPKPLLSNYKFSMQDDNPSKVADTEPVKLDNVNPFELPQGFKTFKIDWEKSTLDKDATIQSMKDHADKLSDPLTNTKWVWPYFIATRLLGKEEILKNTELIEALYTHYPTDDHYLELTGKELVDAVKKIEELPQYFHRTKKLDGALIPMLKDGRIQRTYQRKSWNQSVGGAKAGAFVSIGKSADKWTYGRYMFCLKDLEINNYPLTHYADNDGYWPGFIENIDLKQSLTHVSVPDDESQDNIEKIKKVLEDNGYTNVVVCTESFLKASVYNNKIPMPIIIPKFWLSSYSKSRNLALHYLAKRDGELISTSYRQYYPKELYTQNSIEFADFSR